MSLMHCMTEQSMQALSEPCVKSRMRLLILAKTPDKKRFEALGHLTGLSDATWRTWWRRDTAPSGVLIESIAKCWPEYAFWLVTGLDGTQVDHLKPKVFVVEG